MTDDLKDYHGDPEIKRAVEEHARQEREANEAPAITPDQIAFISKYAPLLPYHAIQELQNDPDRTPLEDLTLRVALSGSAGF